jgi:Cu-processing system ATP-binding protein
MRMSTAMIDIAGLTKRFGALAVLQGVELGIRAGRVTAVVGPNGAGKTTLIKILLGLTKPDAGRVAIGGVAVNGDPGYRAGIGYMPQIARFPENLTAREVLRLLEDLRRPVAASDRELLELFGLGEHLDKKLRTLSGGTRQKVNAAAAFLFSPGLLVLDEPTAGLDPVSSGILKDKVRREREAGRTFLLTSHVMSELEELCDDVVFLLEGRVRFAGPMGELKCLTRQASLERAVAHVMLGTLRGAAA